jgi:hypothetical protein
MVLPTRAAVLRAFSDEIAAVGMNVVMLKGRSIRAVLYGACLVVFEGIVAAFSNRRAGKAGNTKMVLRYVKESGVWRYVQESDFR